MWFNAPITTAWGSTNQRLSAASVTSVICQNTYNVTVTTLQSLGIPTSVIINSNLANGCGVVTPLPSAASPVRIAYKLYFAVTPAQWTSITAAFHTASGMKTLVQYGHTMCGSSIFFQTATGTTTAADVSFSTQPSVSTRGNHILNNMHAIAAK